MKTLSILWFLFSLWFLFLKLLIGKMTKELFFKASCNRLFYSCHCNFCPLIQLAYNHYAVSQNYLMAFHSIFFSGLPSHVDQNSSSLSRDEGFSICEPQTNNDTATKFSSSGFLLIHCLNFSLLTLRLAIKNA